MDKFYSSENVAYKATAASYPETFSSYGPEKAVDGDTDTLALTITGKDPWLSVTLSEYLNISRISVYVGIGTCVT